MGCAGVRAAVVVRLSGGVLDGGCWCSGGGGVGSKTVGGGATVEGLAAASRAELTRPPVS